MKKLLIIIFTLTSTISKAQTLDEVLSPKQMTITWLGVDFVHGKYKFAGDGVAAQYLPDYCLRINKTIAEDHHRYYFPIAYKKDFVYNTSAVDSANALINESAIVSKMKGVPDFTAQTIKDIISGYEFPPDLKGVGLIYIYENLIQTGHDKGTIWMAFIIIETKEVLFIQNTTSEVSGGTIEVAWAYPALSMLRKSKGDINKWYWTPEKFNLLKN